jgi:hypothetical protein
MVACETNQLPLSKIDMSDEVPQSYYTYFRFINRTGAPIMLEFLYAGKSDGWRYIIPNDHDIVEVCVDGDALFATPDQLFGYVRVYYNYNDEFVDVVTMFYDETMINSPMFIESWAKRRIDDNSLLLSYTFTKEHYDEAKRVGRRIE